MKNKIIVLFIFMLFPLSVLLAQHETINYDSTLNHLFIQAESNKNHNQFDFSSVAGSPYETESFVIGKVYQKSSKKSGPYLLRYDVFNDEIQIKMDSKGEKIQSMNKTEDIFIIMEEKEYHYLTYSNKNEKLNEGYLILLNKGKNCNLFLKRTKTYKEKQLPKDGFHEAEPAKFVDHESYYYTEDGELLLLAESKKKILQQLSKFENELKKEIKTKNLNVRIEKDLIALMVYYDVLLK